MLVRGGWEKEKGGKVRLCGTKTCEKCVKTEYGSGESRGGMSVGRVKSLNNESHFVDGDIDGVVTRG